jgi:hypothetical protein
VKSNTCATPNFGDDKKIGLLCIFEELLHFKKKRKRPMYLLTLRDVNDVTLAWEMMYTYFHRWEAEQGFRFLKSEMGLEYPRLWFWTIV